jgi:hypothetical protein
MSSSVSRRCRGVRILTPAFAARASAARLFGKTATSSGADLVAAFGHARARKRGVKEILKTEARKKPGLSSSPCEGPVPAEADPSIEYLQEAIARLLMKNEAMRIELFTIRQKIATIERIVSGAGCEEPGTHLPPCLIVSLRDLCRSEAGWFGPRNGLQPNSGNVPGVRNQEPGGRRVHQIGDSLSGGKR